MKQFLFMDIKPSRNRFTESHWICTDCTVLHRNIHSRCSITVLQNRPQDPKATVLDLGFVNQTICERAAVQSDRHKNPKGHDARHHSGATLAFEICEGSQVFGNALAKNNAPGVSSACPNHSKNGRVPIKKKNSNKRHAPSSKSVVTKLAKQVRFKTSRCKTNWNLCPPVKPSTMVKLNLCSSSLISVTHTSTSRAHFQGAGQCGNEANTRCNLPSQDHLSHAQTNRVSEAHEKFMCTASS